MSAIEWTERTWNPTTGCDRVSPGCDNCYALIMAGRLKAMGQPKYQADGGRMSGPGFKLTMHPDTLGLPLKVRKPTTFFVNSMSDLFHAGVIDEFVARVFAVMALTPRHTYQILTKRPQRMAALLSQITREPHVGFLDLVGNAADDIADNEWVMHGRECEPQPEPWPLRNVWLGTSIETDRYTFRANHLRNTPAAVRFLSLEPLLGPLPSLNLTGIDWVIVGAESGRGARPMDLDWVRPIRDSCVEHGIPFFLKQDATAAGRKIPLPELDGQIWDQMPKREPV